MQNDKDLNPEIFKFDKRDIDSYMLRTLNIRNKFKKSFIYLYDKISTKQKGAYVIKDKMDLENLTWSEGKNYNWLALTDSIENPLVNILIRHYGNHFTIFFKYKYKITDNSELDDYFYTRTGVFTFETNLDNMSDKEHDSYIEDRFKDINVYLHKILESMKEDDIRSVWNSYSLSLEKDKPRPKHIICKNIWDGDETVDSIDLLIFAVEELFHKYLEIFSETDMLEKIKTMKVGDTFGSKEYPYEVVEIRTEVKDDYYHNVGLVLKQTNFTGKTDEKWDDVYALTRWRYNEIFGIKEKE